jgi:predicted nucleic acid-binding protein
MTERSFFDTDILVYTDDADATDKRERALQLWQDHRIAGRAVISVQVLKEYYVASTRKLGVPADRDREARALRQGGRGARRR